MVFFTLIGLTVCFYFLSYIFLLWFSDCDLQLAFFEKFGQNLESLRDKVVWLTGGSTALGRMMAVEVGRHGGKLALSSRSSQELNEVKASCLETNPLLSESDILIFYFDAEDIASHKSAIGKVLLHFGKIDIVIMNEDKWERNTWEETSQSTDRLLFHSNLFGVVSLSRLLVKYFSLRGKGNIGVASSIAGLIGVPYSGSYAGAKHALHGYFESLRFEKIGENICITLLCFGSTKLLQENCTEKTNSILKKKKIKTERCAHLCLSAVINNLDEVWLAVFPVLPLIYGIKYFPNVVKALLNYLKPKEESQRSISATDERR